MEIALGAIWAARPAAAIVDTLTDRVCFLKHWDSEIPVNQELIFSDYLRGRLNTNWIHPEDVGRFDALLKLPEPGRQGEEVLFSFRVQEQGGIRWAQLILNSLPDGHRVLLSMRWLSRQEADEQDAIYTLNQTIRKVVKADFRSHTVRTLKEPAGEEHLTYRYRPELGDLGVNLEDLLVHPEDLDTLRKALNREHIQAWFQAGNARLEVFYRRKTNGLYRWVKLVVQQSAECTPERPVYLFYLLDVHRTMSTLAAPKTVKLPEEKQSAQVQTFYENIWNALSFFTQQYKDYYIVDLQKDQYVKYKVSRDLMTGVQPYVGCYSEMAAQQLAKVEGGEGNQDLSCFASLEELRSIMEDKVSFEYTFRMADGRRYRTIGTRLASENGMPTKIIFRTVQDTEEHRLRVRTFGSFEVYGRDGMPISFTKKKSKQLLAYLIDKSGLPVATIDLVQDVLEKHADDLNAKKYVSTLFRMAVQDLERAGYRDIIVKEWNSLRVNVDKLDCDYYHLMNGDSSYWTQYHNEYMKEYSWAEETNAEILHLGGI